MFEWWWEFLYNCARAINKIIDVFFKLFLFFAGAAPANVNQEIAGDADTNILVNIFTSNGVAVMFLGFLGFSALVLMVSIIIALVRSEWTSKDNGEGKAKIFKHTLKGFLLVFLIPTIFSIGIWATSIVLSAVVSGMSGTDPNDYSLAQQLFEMCLPENPSAYGTEPWTSSYSALDKLGYNMHDYEYLIAFLAGIIIVFIIGLAALNLVERIIDLVFLYLVSPFMIAVSPLDEGNRLGIWKDLVISKLLSVAGMIVCFYIYFLCMPIVEQIFNGNSFIVKAGHLIFAIGGALAARKGGLLISNLVGHNTAMIEGQQAGQTAQIVGTGLRAGLSVTTTLVGGALGLLAGKKDKDSNSNGTGSGNADVLGGAGGGAGMTANPIANILSNNMLSSFAGIQGGGNNSPLSSQQGLQGAPTSSMPMMQPAGVTPQGANISSMPQIMSGGRGFGAAMPTNDIPAGNNQAMPTAQPKVEMPVDSDIRNALNGNGFSSSGNNGEQK